MKTHLQKKNAVRRMVMIAMFAAMAFVAMLVIHIKVSFLTLDVKDAVITLCGLCFGPLSALIVSVLVPVLEFATVSTTGPYGLIMNILGSVSFSVTASLIYKYKKNIWGAAVGLLSGAVLMTAVMLVANLFITPLFLEMPREAVREMIPPLLLPFNLLKGAINVGVVLLFYKNLSRLLRKTGFLPEKANAGEGAPQAAVQGRVTTLLVAAVAVVLIAVSVILIFTVMGGKFDFGA